MSGYNFVIGLKEAAISKLKKMGSAFDKVKKSVTETQAAIDKIPRSLDDLEKEAEEFKRGMKSSFSRKEVRGYKRELKEVEKQIGRLNGKGGGEWFNSSGAKILELNQFNQAVGDLAGVLDRATGKTAEYSDGFADVQKTTGLSAAEAAFLQDKLEEIDTRTGVMALADISRVAGEFGMRAVEDIVPFTNAVNKANVALGDNFGNSAETVARELSKVKGLFEETKNMAFDQAILKIGSGLNAMGNELGTNAANLTDFAQRMGTLGKRGTNLSQTMGIGATLEKLGIDSQIAAGGLTNLFLNAGKESERFAGFLGMNVEQYKEMLNNSPNDVMFDLMYAMQGLSATEMTEALNFLKIGGSQETVKVFGALSSNINTVRTNQELYSSSVAAGTSVLEEAALKEGTLAAEVEKTQKWLEKQTVAFGQSVSAALPYVSAVGDVSLTISSTLPALSALGSGLGKLSGNLKKAAVVQKLLNVTMLNNPYVAIGVAVVVATAAIYAFVTSTSAAEEATQALHDVGLEASQSIVQQKVEVEQLVGVLQSEAFSREAQIRALERLQEISPEHFAHLDIERAKTKELTEAKNAYVASILKEARVKAAQKKIEDLESRKLDIEANKDTGVEWYQTAWNVAKNIAPATGGYGSFKRDQAVSKSSNIKEELESIEAQQEVLAKIVNNSLQEKAVKSQGFDEKDYPSLEETLKRKEAEERAERGRKLWQGGGSTNKKKSKSGKELKEGIEGIASSGSAKTINIKFEQVKFADNLIIDNSGSEMGQSRSEIEDVCRNFFSNILNSSINYGIG